MRQTHRRCESPSQVPQNKEEKHTFIFHQTLDKRTRLSYTKYAIKDRRKGHKTMGTNAQAVPTVEQSPITRTIFNLDNMEEVTLVKDVPAFVPVTSQQEALQRIQNDAKLYLQIRPSLF